MADLNTQLVFGANTAGAEAGVRTVRRSLKELADTATSAGKSIEGVGDRAGKSLEGMGDGAEVAARKIQRDTNSMKGSLQRYLSTLEAGSKDSRRYWESMADFKGIDKTALRPLLDQLDAYNAKAKGAQETTTSWVGSLSRMGASAAGVAAVAATAGVAAKAMFDASASAERLRTMLDFSTGGNSGKEIEYLRGVTYRLGLEFASTAKAYGQFSAAAKGTTLEGDKARAVFESVAKASAVMGLSASDTSGVLLALQQMLSKGTVSAEELRGQLGERLPGSFQVAAKAMGVTTAELGKMLEQGEVIADDFLPKFAAALEKNIGGASEKAAQRLDASVNRVATAWERLKQNGGDSGTSSFMAGQYEILADGFNGISEAMERARASGSGFVGQMVSGAVAAAKFANPLQAVSYSAIETGNALKQAESEFAALQKRGDVMGGNIYYKAEMANLAALIKELKAAQAEKQKLATGAAPNMNEGVTASGRAREAYYTQRAKDMEAANAFRLNQSGVPASYLKDMAELIRLNQAGVIVGKEYTDALAKQQDLLLKKTTTVRGSAAAANAEQNAYETLISSIRAKIEADKLELAGGAALTESQRIRIKLDQDLAAGRVKLSAQNERSVRLALEELSASEASALAAKALSKSYAEAAAERIKTIQSMERAADGLQSQNDALREEIELIGLSTEQQTFVLQQRNDVIILTKEATLAELERQSAISGTQTRVEIALAAEIEALKERNALLGAKGIKDAAKQAEAEWARSVEKYEDIFRQGFADMLNNGKDGWKSFTRSLVTTFKTTVADQIYKMFAQPFVVKLVGSLMGFTGLSGVAGAASGGGNSVVSGVQTASNLNTLWGAGSQALWGSTAGASAASLGYANTVGAVGGDALGALISSNGGWAGVSATGASGGAAAGAGGFGAIPVVGWIAAGMMAASSAYKQGYSANDLKWANPIGLIEKSATKLLTSLGVSDKLANILTGASLTAKILMWGAGTPHMGAGAIYSEAGGLQEGKDLYSGANFGMGMPEEYTKGMQEGVSAVAKNIADMFDGVAETFGQKAGFEIATAFADDTSKDGAWGSLRISQAGKDLLNWNDTRENKWAPREFANGEEGYKEYLAEIAKDTRKVLIDMDLPSWADTMLESIGEAANMEQLSATLQQIGIIQAAFVELGKSIDGFAGMTDKAFEALMKASGGIEALSANVGTYYGNFYSEQERAAQTTAMMTAELAKYDTALPQSKEEYRKLVEEQLAAGEEGAKLAAVLLSLSGVFAETANAAEAAAASIAGKRFDLENRLLVLQGKDREALDRQRGKEWEALTKESPELGRLISQIWELEDAANAAAKIEAARQSSYSALENSIARERDAIDVQRSLAAESVDTLTGIFETVRGNVRELYSEVGGTAAMQVSQANAFIDQALRNAQTTGYMPDGAKLSEAIGTARSGLSSGAYTSQFEADRDRLVLAGKLSTLGEITGEQLTTAERQLKYSEEQIEQLDKTLDYWRTQIDIANGTYEATLSVAEAISKLQALMFPDAQKPSTVPNASGGGASFGGGSGAASGPAAAAKYNDLQFIGGGDPARQAVIDQERIAKLDMLSPIYHSFDGTGDLLGLFDAIKAAGGTLADLSTLSGYWQSDWRKAAESVGVPAFAVGTNYVPRDMLAQIHEGEAIVPKAYNPAANPGMAGGGTARLEALIEKLTAKVEQLEGAARATASNTSGLPQMADQFDSVTNGGNAIRNKAIA